MFLDRVIGRRGITIQLPPSILAKNIILKPISGRVRKHWRGLAHSLKPLVKRDQRRTRARTDPEEPMSIRVPVRGFI
jgi:hypothetical protein